MPLGGMKSDGGTGIIFVTVTCFFSVPDNEKDFEFRTCQRTEMLIGDS